MKKGALSGAAKICVKFYVKARLESLRESQLEILETVLSLRYAFPFTDTNAARMIYIQGRME